MTGTTDVPQLEGLFPIGAGLRTEKQPKCWEPSREHLDAESIWTCSLPLKATFHFPFWTANPGKQLKPGLAGGQLNRGADTFRARRPPGKSWA